MPPLIISEGVRALKKREAKQEQENPVKIGLERVYEELARRDEELVKMGVLEPLLDSDEVGYDFYLYDMLRKRENIPDDEVYRALIRERDELVSQLCKVSGVLLQES